MRDTEYVIGKAEVKRDDESVIMTYKSFPLNDYDNIDRGIWKDIIDPIDELRKRGNRYGNES